MDAKNEGQALLTTREAALRLRLSAGTLQNMRSLGRGPRYVRLKGRGIRGRGAIRYTEEDLARFVAQGRVAQ
jgi:hypothetical protein